MTTLHTYRATVTWTGNRGTGTSGYRDYDRDHVITSDGRPPLPGSSDPAFRGDPSRWTPEHLLVTALSQCHLMSYLHLCAEAGVVVTGYRDDPVGTMVEEGRGGRFTEVILRPHVTVASPEMVDGARRLHEDAHRACFIASSVAFAVRHEPTIDVAGPAAG